MDCGYLGILSLDVAKMQPQQVENRYVEAFSDPVGLS